MIQEIDRKVEKGLEYLINTIPQTVSSVHHIDKEPASPNKAVLDKYYFPECVAEGTHWYHHYHIGLIFKDEKTKQQFKDGLESIFPAERLPTGGKFKDSKSGIRLSDGTAVYYFKDNSETHYLSIKMIVACFPSSNERRYELFSKLSKIGQAWRYG